MLPCGVIALDKQDVPIIYYVPSLTPGTPKAWLRGDIPGSIATQIEGQLALLFSPTFLFFFVSLAHGSCFINFY